MKRAILVCLTTIVLFQKFFGQVDTAVTERKGLEFDFTTVDVGKVRQGSNLEIWFPFTVIGPDSTKLEIKMTFYNPSLSNMNMRSFENGQRDSIPFAYNTMRVGPFNKFLRVKAKSDATLTDLIIKGEIIPKERPWIEWKTTEITFDTIEQGTKQEHYFWFYNRGDSAFTITEAKRSCQCFEATIPQGKINPGDSSYIKVTYSGAYIDRFDKSITVVSTAANSPSKLFYRGVVVAKKE